MVLSSSKIPCGAGLLPGVRVREVVICVAWGGQRDTCAAARNSAGTAQTSTGPARLLGQSWEDADDLRLPWWPLELRLRGQGPARSGRP